MRLEPGNALGRAGRKLRDHAGFNITALIGTPAHKAGAPFHTAPKSVPAPVWFAADVPHLGERHRDDLAIPSGNAVEHLGPKGVVLIGQKLRQLFPLVLIKAELVCHFLRSLVADSNIQISVGDSDLRFYDIPVAIIGRFDHRFRLRRCAG